MPRLGRSDLDVFGLCLGGNVFGWTADEAQSFEVLDAYIPGATLELTDAELSELSNVSTAAPTA